MSGPRTQTRSETRALPIRSTYHPVGDEHSSEKAQELSDQHQGERVASGVARADERQQRGGDENAAREEKNDCDHATETRGVVARIGFVTREAAEDGQESGDTHGDNCLEENIGRNRCHSSSLRDFLPRGQSVQLDRRLVGRKCRADTIARDLRRRRVLQRSSRWIRAGVPEWFGPAENQ